MKFSTNSVTKLAQFSPDEFWGDAMSIVCNTNCLASQLNVATLYSQLHPPLEIGSICVLKTQFDEPVSIIAWAKTSPFAIKRIQSSQCLNLYQSEWLEGNVLLVTSFICKSGYCKSVLQSLVKLMADIPDDIFYFRAKNNKLILKKVTKIELEAMNNKSTD